VTLEAENPLTDVIDDNDVKDILLKINNQPQFLNKKPYIIMKVNDDKIQQKKGKWFKKFKSIKLLNIGRSYLLKTCPELVLLYVSIGSFFGYIVLRIHVAGNMMEFTEILKKTLIHQHTVLEKTENFYVPPELENKKNTTHIFNGVSTNLVPNGKLNQHNHVQSDYTDEKVKFTAFNGTERKYENNKNKIYRIDDAKDKYTYINYNSEEFLNDIGPVALFSQTFPSPYSASMNMNSIPIEEIESDSESEDSDKDDFM